VIDGCTLNIPNIKIKYGFGCTTTSNSGDLLLYGCTINIYGFWSFFEGTNHVELIGNFIDGFGRISGQNSIMLDNKFKQSNGRYGIISTKGEIKTMFNNSSYSVKDYKGLKCAIYHNPNLAGDLTLYYGVYGGYEDIAYIEEEGGEAVLELRGSKLLGGYNLHRESDNVDFFHSFRYKGTVFSNTGDKLSNIKLIVKDTDGNVTHDVKSDQDGNIDIWIRYYQDIAKTN
jgi:hypothetical protein